MRTKDKWATLTFRLTKAEKAALKRAARTLKFKSTSAYVRRLAVVGRETLTVTPKEKK